jgi:hypothetical protein
LAKRQRIKDVGRGAVAIKRSAIFLKEAKEISNGK